ncbi:MAG: YihY/virulence factor BrkB family protein [Bacteroidia bacterium]
MYQKLIKRNLQRIYLFLRRIKPPGFHGVGLYDVLRFLIVSLSSSRFNLMSAAMAYNFFFSLFPTLILVFLLVPYIYIPHINIKHEVTVLINQYIPRGSIPTVEPLVLRFLQKKESIWWLLLNVFLALNSSIRGIFAMMGAFSHHDGENRRKGLLRWYAVAFSIFFILVLFFLVSITILNLGEFLIDWLYQFKLIPISSKIILKGLNYLINFTLILFGVSMSYKLGSIRGKKWRFFSAGSVVGSTLLLLTLIALNYYFANFGNYNKLYGGMATVVILMLWFYYVSAVLLIGFELNVAIDDAKKYRLSFQQRREDEDIGEL